MEDRGTYINENDLFDVSFELEMSHVLVREENPGVNDHVSPSVEVVNENQQKMEDPEVNDNINNDNLSVEDSVNINDGPGGPDVATTYISKRKKCALALITSVALLALIIGLSVGIGGKNGERSITSSANSALTLEDCLAEAAAAGSVPTAMPTDNSNFPTYDYASVESGEDDAAIGQSSMLVDEFVATGVSNDIPVEEEIPSEETGEAVSSEEPPRPSNDVDDINFLVRRDLRGNIKRSATANKVKEHTPASKSRRLQCQELLAGGL